MRAMVRSAAIACIVVIGAATAAPAGGASPSPFGPTRATPQAAAAQRMLQLLEHERDRVQLMSVGSGTDPVGDTAGDPDGRADLTSISVSYTTSSIVLSTTTFVFDNPLTSYNWQAYALGDLNWIDPNTIAFGIDTNGDDDPEYVVVYFNVGGGVVAAVVPVASPETMLCLAAPGWHAPSRVYRVSFPPSCIGSPGSVRAVSLIHYETASTITEDVTGFTSAATPTAPTGPTGYWMVDRTGHVYSFGVPHLGNAPTTTAADIEPTPTGNGYWIVNDAGAVYSFGDATYFGGSPSLAPGETVTSLSRSWDAAGYYLFTSLGRVFAWGDALDYGDLTGLALNGPVLDSIPLTNGIGYYMVGSDGGVFSFGTAPFHGSTGGMRLNAPVMSLVPDGDGNGYWLVARDGGIFAFSAPFRGSLGGVVLNRPITGMVRFGNGYLMVGEDGGIFNFSDKPFLGSLGGNPPRDPVVSVAGIG